MLLLAGIGGALFVTARSTGGGGLAFDAAPVKRGALAARVTATGTLSPLVEVQVGSQVSGRIQALHADFNSRVTQGQVIARIDPRLFETDVARQKANVVAAEAAVAKAEADRTDARLKHERAAGLFAKGMGAKADADSARATYEAARAQVEAAEASLAQARAALEQAETQLAYTTIVSPIDGVVISRDVDVGQTVAASLQAPTLFTIAEDLAKMEVHTNVAEADVGRLESGIAVEFTVDAYPTDRFRGVVKEIRYAALTVQNVVTYDAVVAVDNPDLKLRPGMTADVSFVVAERADVLLVPNAALRYAPPLELRAKLEEPPDGTGGRVVWVLEKRRPRPVRVQVGITDGRFTEVVDGLAEDELVITGAAGGEAAAPQEPPRPTFGRFL